MNTTAPVTVADPRRFLRLTAFADTPDPSAGSDTLCLPFDLRTKSRWMVTLASGREALLVLPRGRAMRGGDQLVAADGTRVNVVAADESLAHVTVANAHELLRVAYHLGNRHVAVEIGHGYLRLAADAVLENMVRGLGAQVERVMAPFEPEGGAYAGTHAGHDHAAHAGHAHASHDHGDHSGCNHPDHQHGHAHGHAHAHENGPGHDQGDHSQCHHGHSHGHDHDHGHGSTSKARIHDFADQVKKPEH